MWTKIKSEAEKTDKQKQKFNKINSYGPSMHGSG